MADTTSRSAPSRGPRGSGRGGRGGSRGGGRFGTRQSNGDGLKDNTPQDDFTDHGEYAELKKQYSSSLMTLRELFPDWADGDLLFALQDTQGDLTSTIERISEGHVAQFADVKHHKERAPKPKIEKITGPPLASAAEGKPIKPVRGAFDSSRGGRGRSERGARGASRGGRGGHGASNGDRATTAGSVPTPGQGWESSADVIGETTAADASAWTNVVASKDTPAAASEGAKPTLLPENSAPAKKTWAQMFAKPLAPASAPKPAGQSASASMPIAPAEEPAELAHDEIPTATDLSETSVPPSVPDEATSTGSFEVIDPEEANVDDMPAVEITPSKVPLTVENVEHLPDVSQPAPTGTEASTIDSTHAPDSAAPSVIGQSVQPPIGRPGLGGFATTALKATSTSNQRSASFQRRILEQSEPVVMPGSRDATERTALQFGSLGLNGEPEDDDDTVEDAQTIAQPPQPSPPSQPRATLPPAPRAAEAPSAPEPVQQTIKPAPGLPPAPQQQAQQQSPSTTMNSHYMSQPGSQVNPGYGQYGRYGQSGMPAESNTSAAAKQYDAFGQPQQSQHSAYDSYGGQSHAQQQGAYSSAAGNDYSQYYTADQRNAYQNYYNSYGGQHGYGGQQETGASQRAGSNFGGASTESGYPSSQSQQQSQSRYNDTQSPAPSAGATQQGSNQGQQSHVNQQSHAQNQHAGYGGYGGYGYGRGMDPYSNYYMQQQQYGGYNQQGYGGAFGKGNMYGGPQHGYGMTQGSGYDQHSASPATNASGYGQQASSHGRESALSGGLGDYARSGSTQPSQAGQQSTTASSYGGMHDVFSRGTSGYPSQGQQYGQTTSSAQDQESHKGFGNDTSKTGTSGANSSALGGQPGRPGSATNNALPPPQSQQHSGFGQGYPGQQQSSQYGGLGGLGGQHASGQQQQQQQGAGGYGNYGGGGFGSYGQGQQGQSYGRGGWGGNYGH